MTKKAENPDFGVHRHLSVVAINWIYGFKTMNLYCHCNNHQRDPMFSTVKVKNGVDVNYNVKKMGCCGFYNVLLYKCFY